MKRTKNLTEMLHFEYKNVQFGGSIYAKNWLKFLMKGYLSRLKTAVYSWNIWKNKTIQWSFISWLYDNDHFITGPKAISNQVDAGDMFGAGEDDNTTADEDFEAEAKSDLVDPPVDEAGVSHQAVIDGAEVDIDLIQKAIEYAQKDENHYLLPTQARQLKTPC